MEPSTTHDALKPLNWLIGKWKATTSDGSTPITKPGQYQEEISFQSIGQPILNFSSTSWHAEKKSPMHLESGFLRIKPGTNIVAFIVSHNFGLTTIEEGTVDEDKKQIEVESKEISRMSFAKEPNVVATKRRYTLIGEDELEYIMWMETSKSPKTEHLKVIYKKCN